MSLAAVNALSRGRLYALVEGLSTCESLQCDTTVGYGGSPDETGETTLDALVMDGEGMRMGAVANLHRVKDAARVAWAVMNYTKHSMLVGEAATKFAIQMGFKEENLTTAASRQMLRVWKAMECQPNFWQNVYPDPTKSCGPYRPLSTPQRNIPSRYPREIDRWLIFIWILEIFILKRNELMYYRYHHDTLGMVVVDATGNVPGRVGDSPIPGAGAYAVSGVGGAASTGDGDILMRFLPR
ncbi:unnamed protein product [Heligmosomoides polygyrus]|uniref:N(4)-(Beta-N-acetylglucosaminyl)-L-asparaginase n=1 Tax=Heligmosomoides polygyrus TaxID=6339 RepID=A0A3P7XJG3_HELPZ|nr:unnamed protein product [Heligmosomoides polygyrus]